LLIAVKRTGETDRGAGGVREILTDRPPSTRPPRELLHEVSVALARPTVNGRKSLPGKGRMARGRANW
jgi:hypothetical protein